MSNEKRPSGLEDGSEEVELTAEEAMAFQSLPREAEPSRILEERVVTSLREEGILRKGGRPEREVAEPRAFRSWLRPWMVAGSAAASLVLFASGVLVGHWMGTRSTAQAFLAVREQDAGDLALRIQEAGTAYVSALVALGDVTRQTPVQGGAVGGPSPALAELLQGSEVALGALYAAAYELARLNPGDADVRRVLQILEDRRARETGVEGEARNVVWF